MEIRKTSPEGPFNQTQMEDLSSIHPSILDRIENKITIGPLSDDEFRGRLLINI